MGVGQKSSCRREVRSSGNRLDKDIWTHFTNSLGLRIPKSFAKELDIEPDSKVDISLKDGRLIVRPLPRPEYSLERLLSEVTHDNLHEEVDFGEPSGRESL